MTSAPEPKSFLCTNAQLYDMQRFCIDSVNFYPISVDPTFDLGDFCVTVISYHNLFLKNRTTGKNPVMLGPMLVHRRKLFSSYHFSSRYSRKLYERKTWLSGYDQRRWITKYVSFYGTETQAPGFYEWFMETKLSVVECGTFHIISIKCPIPEASQTHFSVESLKPTIKHVNGQNFVS